MKQCYLGDPECAGAFENNFQNFRKLSEMQLYLAVLSYCENFCLLKARVLPCYVPAESGKIRRENP